MAKYFKDSEFACKCKKCGGLSIMNPAFVERLDRLREKYGKPIVVTSGYRCELHPSEAKKKTVGAHRQGRAVDIPCGGQDAFSLIALAIGLDFTGIGVSQKSGSDDRFVHLDDVGFGDEEDDPNQPRPTCWSY